MMEVQNSPAALDLCIRKRPKNEHTTLFVDSASCQYSPVSNNSDSETSFSERSHLPKVKTTRPFKAYPKDPLNLALGVATTNINRDSVEAFTEFRQRVLSQVQNNDGTNKNMRRIPHHHQNRDEDPNYWEKRRKNNEAAKRSRDARRAKEDEIAIRCAFLEQENLQLKFKIANLEAERQRLHDLVYRS